MEQTKIKNLISKLTIREELEANKKKKEKHM